VKGCKFKSNKVPLKHENDKKLTYNCNAIQTWYITLVTVFLLHVTKLFPLSKLMDHYASLLTVSMIVANFVSIWTYVSAFYFKTTHRMSGISDLIKGHMFMIFLWEPA
jgi:Delta24(24(1))-sterol reductase